MVWGCLSRSHLARNLTHGVLSIHNICKFLLLYYRQRKIFFRRSIFLYSPCPNLEGIKDALSYKFRILTIGQSCCAVCTTRLPGPRDHRDAFSSSSERRKRHAFRQACSAGHRASSDGLVVDSTFEQSENVAITR